jgi:uncharacterized protein GlcG (DUF336 family)
VKVLSKVMLGAASAGLLLGVSAAMAAPARPAAAPPAAAPAAPVKFVRSIPFSLALKGATAALACAERFGSHTSVGVMDVAGNWKVLFVPDNNTMIGYKVLPLKMNAALMRQAPTGPTVAQSKPPARAEIDTSGNVLERIAPGFAVISPGAEPLFVGEGKDREFVGVIGVGGATTPGDVDNVCAREGAAAIMAELK